MARSERSDRPPILRYLRGAKRYGDISPHVLPGDFLENSRDHNRIWDRLDALTKKFFTPGGSGFLWKPPDIGSYDDWILDTGPYAYWPTGLAPDETGNGHNLAAGGGAGQTTPQTTTNGSVRDTPTIVLSGGGDGDAPMALDVGADIFSPSFNADGWTAQTWFKPSQTSFDNAEAEDAKNCLMASGPRWNVVIAAPDVPATGWRLRTTTDQKLTFDGEDGGGLNFTLTTPEPCLTVDEWHHVAVVRRPTSLIIFVNGEVVGAKVWNEAEPDYSGGGSGQDAFFLGGCSSAGSQTSYTSYGEYADCCLWDRPLSTTEIYKAYQYGIEIPSPEQLLTDFILLEDITELIRDLPVQQLLGGDDGDILTTEAGVAQWSSKADALTDFQTRDEKGVASGYAGLDGSALVPEEQLGSGTPNLATFLRGDRSWVEPPFVAPANEPEDLDLLQYTVTPPGYDDEVLTDSPSAFWKLDAATAADGDEDATANNLDLTSIIGSPTFGAAAGPFDGSTALTLDGVDDRLERTSLFANTTDFTVEWWFRFSTAPSVKSTLVGQGTVSTNGYFFSLTSARQLQPSRQGIAADPSFAYVFATGTWYHVVVKREGGAWKLYVNGVLEETMTTGAPNGANGTVQLGSFFGANPFAGLLSRVAFYNTAVDDLRILAHYQAISADPAWVARSIAEIGLGGGASSLDDLTDVDTTGAADGDALVYDSATSTWLPVAGAGGAVAVSDLTDVDLTGLADGDGLVYDSASGQWVPGAVGGGGSSAPDYILIRDEKSSGTSGGIPSGTGSYLTRDLNTEVEDAGGHASLASNQITLQPGTYRFSISCPAWNVQRHKARLQNITAGTTVALGTTEYCVPNGTTNRSFIRGTVTIAAATVFEVQHRVTVASGSRFGIESSFGDTEIYTIAEFWKTA